MCVLFGLVTFEERLKNEHHKDVCLKRDLLGLRLWILLTTPHSIMNTIVRIYVFRV